jgi:hypothetical protein
MFPKPPRIATRIAVIIKGNPKEGSIDQMGAMTSIHMVGGIAERTMAKAYTLPTFAPINWADSIS